MKDTKVDEQQTAESTVEECELKLALADVSAGELDELKCDELRELCEIENLDGTGKKADLLKRLKAKKLGGDKRFIPGKTICQYCGAILQVNGTATSDVADGRTLIIRQVKCRGKRRHSYTIKEIVGQKR